MPGPTQHRGAKLVQAVRAGAVSADRVRDSARRLLRLIARVGAFDDPTIADEQALDQPEHRALIRRAGAEGVVLLKNDGILPLDQAKLSSIAVLGPNAKTAQIMGGGSAQVNAHYRVSPYDGIATLAGEQVELAHAPGCANHKMLPALGDTRVVAADGQPGFGVDYFNSGDLSGPVVFHKHVSESELMWFGEVAPGVRNDIFSARLSTRFTPDQGGEHQFGLVSAGVSRLFVDGTLVVDNWTDWRPGDNFFGSGNAEAIGTIDLRAGQSYDVAIEYSSVLPGDRGTSALGIRALRVGVHRPLGDEAIEQAVQLASAADVALLFVGLNGEWDTEGSDRPHMDLVGRQNELIARVAAANPRTVVVLQTGGPITMPWLNEVAGVVQAWYPGQECGNAIADVLFGAVNPAGRLPQTFPVRLEDNPAYGNYPGENGKVRYAEGIFVGYRSYEQREIAPLFPFGFGLSYTTFEYANLRLSASAIGPSGELTAQVDVTNTGARAGQEVVQLYVRDDAASAPRPPKELKGFAKLELAPGATGTASFALDQRALAYWDTAQHAWVAEAGAFEVLVGSSSQDIRARVTFELKETAVFDRPSGQ
jgi:beta-glucosidase